MIAFMDSRLRASDEQGQFADTKSRHVPSANMTAFSCFSALTDSPDRRIRALGRSDRPFPPTSRDRVHVQQRFQSIDRAAPAVTAYRLIVGAPRGGSAGAAGRIARGA